MTQLYHKHESHNLETTMVGPRWLKLIRIRLRGYGDREWARGNYILAIGPVAASWGPAGGVEEGRASVPDELMRWGRIWWSRSGDRALAIDWTRNA